MKTTAPNEKNFLIIRLSSMGDVILTTPLVRCLRHAFPAATIDFVVKTQFADVLKHNPHINNIFELDKSQPNAVAAIRRQITSQNYFVIDLQNNPTSRHLRPNNCQYVKFNKKLWQKLALVWLKKDLLHGRPVLQRYIDTATSALPNVVWDGGGPELWLPATTSRPPAAAATLTISIAPAATHQTKQWPAEYFAKLIQLLAQQRKCHFYLLGAEDAVPACNIIQAAAEQASITNMAGRTSILDVAELLSQSNALITGDTGIMHIASTQKTPTVAIFGGTTPSLGFAPVGCRHRLCQADLACRPCSHIGRRRCPKGHLRCMRLLTPDIVLEQVEDLLDNREI